MASVWGNTADINNTELGAKEQGVGGVCHNFCASEKQST